MEYEGSGLDLVIKITYPTHLNSNAKTQMQVGRLWKIFQWWIYSILQSFFQIKIWEVGKIRTTQHQPETSATSRLV